LQTLDKRSCLRRLRSRRPRLRRFPSPSPRRQRHKDRL